MNSWNSNFARFSASMYRSRACDVSNPLTFSIKMYSTVFNLSRILHMCIRALVRASPMSFLLPTRVNGWHGGDIRMQFTFILSNSFGVNFCMLLLSTLVSGWLWRYTRLAVVLMSTAAATSPAIPLTVKNKNGKWFTGVVKAETRWTSYLPERNAFRRFPKTIPARIIYCRCFPWLVFARELVYLLRGAHCQWNVNVTAFSLQQVITMKLVAMRWQIYISCSSFYSFLCFELDSKSNETIEMCQYYWNAPSRRTSTYNICIRISLS